VVSIYLSIFFYSSPNLSGRRLDVYHTSTHGVALVRMNLECMSEMCGTRFAENTGRNISAPSHNFVGLYLRSWSMHRQSEKAC